MTRPRKHVEVLSLVFHNSTLKKNIDAHANCISSNSNAKTRKNSPLFFLENFLMAKKNVNARF